MRLSADEEKEEPGNSSAMDRQMTVMAQDSQQAPLLEPLQASGVMGTGAPAQPSCSAQIQHTPQQQQRVLEILKSDPQQMSGYIRHPQQQSQSQGYQLTQATQQGGQSNQQPQQPQPAPQIMGPLALISRSQQQLQQQLQQKRQELQFQQQKVQMLQQQLQMQQQLNQVQQQRRQLELQQQQQLQNLQQKQQLGCNAQSHVNTGHQPGSQVPVLGVGVLQQQQPGQSLLQVAQQNQLPPLSSSSVSSTSMTVPVVNSANPVQRSIGSVNSHALSVISSVQASQPGSGQTQSSLIPAPVVARQSVSVGQGALAVGADPTKQKLIQQQLILLLHSQKCARHENQNGNQCFLPHCRTMKNVLNHMKACQAGKNCSFTHCSSSRQIISHFQLCTRLDCPVCHPLKQEDSNRGNSFQNIASFVPNQTTGPVFSAITTAPTHSVQQAYAALGIPYPSNSMGPSSATGNGIGIPSLQHPPPPPMLQNAVVVNSSLSSVSSSSLLGLASSGNPLPTTTKVITATSLQGTKGWHQSISPELRNHLVANLVRAIFPSPNKSNMLDRRMSMSNCVSYAQKVESDIYGVANSRPEYYELLAEKIGKIQNELEAKRQRGKAKQALQLHVGTGTFIARVSPVVTTTVSPSTPPDWDKSCESALQALTPFMKIPVQQSTIEFQVLADLVTSSPRLSVTRIERVVNLALWKKFVATRKELMVAKSRDVEMLSALGLTDSELQQHCHVIFNFDPAEGIPDYTDNMVLLFHCTRGSLDVVLSQGLDDRLGRDNGLLGRGIYFTDDPEKATNYDAHNVLIVCGVFLGDCVQSNVKNVREPEKTANQMRNPSDLFFDSIVGRPTGAANEYVIYNRNQCVPLYLIHYQKNLVMAAQTEMGATYTFARSGLPPFSWNPRFSSSPILASSLANRWPFFAQTIFKLMDPDIPDPPSGGSNDSDSDSELEEQLIDFVLDSTLSPPIASGGFNPSSAASTSTNVVSAGASANFGTSSNQPGTSASASSIDKLKGITKTLSGVSGVFSLSHHPIIKLTSVQYGQKKAKWDSPNTVISGMASTSATASHETQTLSQSKSIAKRSASSSAAGAAPASGQENDDGDKDCPICCVQTSNWTSLSCSHKICTDCHGKLFKSGQTMSGKTHTYIKCPFCNEVSGTELGTCPDGTMNTVILSSSLPGYEGHNTISVNYLVKQGKHTLNRTGFLPNSPDGNRIVELLRKAWDRRLIFSIGTSMTTGQSDVLVWNIHHKTGMSGGVQCHAYPDPGYLERLLDELKQYGIE